MEQYLGMKELYDVSLKCVYPLQIGDKEYLENESLIKFDKIQIANLKENKVRTAATGGYADERLVLWETTQDISFSLIEGVISKTGLALLSNSTLIKEENTEEIIPYSEKLESDEEGVITCKFNPIQDNTFFLYKKENGEKILDYAIEDNKILTNLPYTDFIIDYSFIYNKKREILSVGHRLINGYLRLEGKMRLKDDLDGHEKTGIIIIPQIRLMSDLQIQLGRDIGSPNTYKFNVVGYPVGERGEKYVCKFIFLDSDIDSDI